MTRPASNPVAERLDALAASHIDELPAQADPLADALHYLRMDGMFYCRSELSAPWGLDLPVMPDCLWFHVVTSGGCELTGADGETRLVQAGDIVVLPHGGGHCAVDQPDTPTPVVFDLPHDYISRNYAVLRHGGGGAPTEIICGLVQLGHPAARSLLEVLPEVIHVRAAVERPEWEWFSPLLTLLAAEAQAAQPGGETVLTRLCDVLVIQAIRSWIETDPAAQSGWLGALRDPAVGRAIALMHAEPARDWTVAALAREVGMSRSGFSARFTELVGRSPMRYLTRWRMQLAEDLLVRESASILTIATQLGYQSEAAFSRAFKRETGSAPSHARQRSDLMAVAQEIAALSR